MNSYCEHVMQFKCLWNTQATSKRKKSQTFDVLLHVTKPTSRFTRQTFENQLEFMNYVLSVACAAGFQRGRKGENQLRDAWSEGDGRKGLEVRHCFRVFAIPSLIRYVKFRKLWNVWLPQSSNQNHAALPRISVRFSNFFLLSLICPQEMAEKHRFKGWVRRCELSVW